MSSIKYALSKGLQVVLDAWHDNEKHLDSFGNTATGLQFASFWSLIAQYMSKNVDPKYLNQIWFEIANEPFGKKDGDYNQQYQIPAIQSIQKSIPGAKVLVTTFGNYSGVHFWADGDNPKKGESLNKLVSDLSNAGYKNSAQSGIYIAAHQYCDSDYSGTSNGCNPSNFYASLYNDWLSKVDAILKPQNFRWLLTEGNVNCNSYSNCATDGHGNLYSEFLLACFQRSQFLGFTVWMSNSGDNYANANMGNGSSNKDPQFKSYSTVYKQSNGNYTFEDQFG
jgi:hypothetical protein